MYIYNILQTQDCEGNVFKLKNIWQFLLTDKVKYFFRLITSNFQTLEFKDLMTHKYVTGVVYKYAWKIQLFLLC